jgi:hypothetical protein
MLFVKDQSTVPDFVCGFYGIRCAADQYGVILLYSQFCSFKTVMPNHRRACLKPIHFALLSIVIRLIHVVWIIMK